MVKSVIVSSTITMSCMIMVRHYIFVFKPSTNRKGENEAETATISAVVIQPFSNFPTVKLFKHVEKELHIQSMNCISKQKSCNGASFCISLWFLYHCEKLLSFSSPFLLHFFIHPVSTSAISIIFECTAVKWSMPSVCLSLYIYMRLTVGCDSAANHREYLWVSL